MTGGPGADVPRRNDAGSRADGGSRASSAGDPASDPVGEPAADPVGDPPRRAAAPDVPRRGWFDVRWRQLRRAPTPVVRAVLSSTGVAAVLGVLFLAYDLALDAGADPPGGDLRLLAGLLFVGVVAFLGASLTYLVVPQPGRPGVRSRWSAALGLFAALPIAYLALVLLFQVVKPLLRGIGT